MQITRKTEYTLRALYEIWSSGKDCLSLKDICVGQNLPFKYMEHLFSRLRQAGFIKSLHGARGGYCLVKSFEKITLKEIMTTVEDDISVIKCNEDSEQNEFCTGFPCSFYGLWSNFSKKIEKYLDSITLNEILVKLSKGESL